MICSFLFIIIREKSWVNINSLFWVSSEGWNPSTCTKPWISEAISKQRWPVRCFALFGRPPESLFPHLPRHPLLSPFSIHATMTALFPAVSQLWRELPRPPILEAPWIRTGCVTWPWLPMLIMGRPPWWTGSSGNAAPKFPTSELSTPSVLSASAASP